MNRFFVTCTALSLLTWIVVAPAPQGCTNLLVSAGASADGSTERILRRALNVRATTDADRDAFLALDTSTQAAIREVTDMLAASKLLGFSHGANSPSDGK